MTDDGKTVWLLGAGASMSHTGGRYPGIDTFFSQARDAKITAPAGSSVPHDRFRRLYDYVQSSLRASILDTKRRIDIEDLLTFLEIDIARTGTAALLEVRDEAIRLIRDLFSSLSTAYKPNDGDYGALSTSINTQDTVMTFNWDVLLDNSLGRRELLSNRGGWQEKHYGRLLLTQLAHGEDTYAKGWLSPPVSHYSGGFGSYVKLHGSVDWFYCHNPGCRGFNKVFAIREHTKTHICSDCYEGLRPLIVPPVLDKQYDAFPTIRKAWTLAQIEMSVADCLVVWGYSLPPTDIRARWLIRQIRPDVQEVCLVNPAFVPSAKGRKRGFSATFAKPYFNLLRGIVPKNRIQIYEFFTDLQSRTTITEKHDVKVPSNL